MKLASGKIRLSATDLANHLGCRHLTSLDLAVALGTRDAPAWQSPDLQVLRERGMAHETAYLEHLKAQGAAIVDLQDVAIEEIAEAETIAAIKKGVDVIAQATLSDGRWFGRADVLRRVERAGRFGNWSYEVYDCKLARETKAATILQLSLYSELLAGIQWILPESMYVIPFGMDFRPERYRVLDFAAYYRYVKARLENAVEQRPATNAEPVVHCDICRWWPECDAQWRKNDHLSLVAGISRLQRKQLCAWEVNTVEQLAALPLPIQNRPEFGSKEGYAKVREQARVQVAARNQAQPVYEVLEVTNEHGLSLLPEPSLGDIFFDLEGDPFVGVSGREYLFGFVHETQTGDVAYESRWALTADEEKQAFEWFVETVMARWQIDQAMHIYHFTPYEPSALKRLMGRYATCEEEIDRMLRARLFIDLHTVLKRSVRAGVEQYSLKALEVFHDFRRQVPLADARTAMRRMEHSLELSRAPEADESVRKTIALYNADDCLSTRSLRNWLERERLQLGKAGIYLPRPEISDGAPPEPIGERQAQTAALAEILVTGISADPELRSDEEAARWLLANLLDWHRRENKAAWWDYFRLSDLTDEELPDERSALAGLQFVGRVDAGKKVPTDRYTFPNQETDLRAEDTVCHKGEKIGEVIAIDIAARTIDIKKTKKSAEVHPTSIFKDETGPRTSALADALFRLGTWVGRNGVDAPGLHRAARDFLLRRSPRLADGSSTVVRADESDLNAALRLGTLLDHSVLPIQGPPGAGKTFTGARMICDFVRRGKKVGITANSHKVIRNLLDEVLAAAKESDLRDLECVQK
ncbi:MAG: TM0106 family RecB-like putative nuclease, partial [Verrucomicrobia bacterium]|nr:TM0106 family RecB-like putative nuclease [Verrucomicrobiota bacterium]